jgi:putative transposase
MKYACHSKVELYVHLVWATRNREAWFTGDLLSKIGKWVTETGRSIGIDVIASGGAEEHLHVFVSHRPDHRISDIVRTLKGALTHRLRREGNLPDFAWQEGYGAFSVSPNGVEAVTRYIRHQSKHHSRNPNR